MMKKIILVFFIFLILPVFSEKFWIRVHDARLRPELDIAFIGPDFTDYIVNEDELRSLTVKSGLSPVLLRYNDDLSGYSSYDGILSVLNALSDSYPALVSVSDIGDSYERVAFGTNSNYVRRDIWAVKLCADVSSDDTRPVFLIMGEHHARELETSEIVISFISELIDEYSAGDTFVTGLLTGYQLYFIPMVNPDGREVVYKGADIMWRKNTRDNDDDCSYAGLYDGVDLNRNYDWHFAESGTSPYYYSEVYPGSAGFSEYETQAVRDFAEQVNPIASISYHTYGELVLYPFGYSSSAIAPDQDRLSWIAYNIAQKIGSLDGYSKYFAEKSSGLYPASGDGDDYLYGQLGTFSFTVEMGDEFHPLWSEVETLKTENYKGLKEFFGCFMKNYISGYIYDDETGLPLEGVNIKITDLNGYSLVAQRTNRPNGQYYWALADGEHTLAVSKKDYQAQYFCFTVEGDTVRRDFRLKKSSLTADGPEVRVFPNPAAARDSIISIENIGEGFSAECSIFSASGDLVYRFAPKITEGDAVADSFIINKVLDDGTNMRSGIYFVHISLEKDTVFFEKLVKFAFIH